jgi:Peptidase family M49
MHVVIHAGVTSRGAFLRRAGGVVLAALTLNCAPSSAPPPPAETAASPASGASPTVASLDAQIRRFAPVDITADVSGLADNERRALAEMLRAAQVIDGLFIEQVWAGNTTALAGLAADRSPEGQARLHYFLINKGPWSRLDNNASFLDPGAGVPAKPPQANYYPADATRDEVDKWISGLKGPAHDEAAGFFTVIRRSADGHLMAVPYSVNYRNTIAIAADHLKQAAALTTQPSLKRFLELRAEAFLSNDYYPSDIAWMELDAPIEPTIGPYETYEDEWFGYKAAFEAYIAVRDDAETKKLGVLNAELQGLENALPIDPKLRNPKLGAFAPLRVVDVVLSSGDGSRGIQTTAYNLPNDDRVIREKGSKRVMMKNIQDAKFQKVLVPIAAKALGAADRAKLSFDAFFTHTVMHELMHGLGPHQVGATSQAVRLALKDQYAALEEAKADISGLWALQQLADKGVVSADIAQTMYVTFVASTIRSIRFGFTDAHGKGIALQLNYLLDHGAVIVNADGTLSVVDAKIKDAVAGLTHDIMTLQANGDYAGAKALLDKMVVVRPEIQRIVDKLTDVPVDIEPNFATATRVIGNR